MAKDDAFSSRDDLDDVIKDESTPVIKGDSISKYYITTKRLFGQKITYKAVDNVSLEVQNNMVLGLVGESGSGKTTLGKILIGLIQPTSGTVFFRNTPLSSIRDVKFIRKNLQIIFQDPFSSLNPKKRIMDILARPLIIHGIVGKNNVEDKICRLLEEVGLIPATEFLDKYPDQLSGGQRQRIVIAKAISINPSFIVADEPVSSLDANVRGTILRLLNDLRIKHNISMLFITHDILTVRYIADRVAVMYLGRIVEEADTFTLLSRPFHPYTEALLSCVAVPDPDVKFKIKVYGEPMDITERLPACRFYNRCPYAQPICKQLEPPLVEVKKGHLVSCHFATPRETSDKLKAYLHLA